MVDETLKIKTFSSNELENAKRKIAEAKRIKREEADLRRRGGIFAANTEEGESRRTLPRQKQSAKVKPITKDRTSKAAFTKTNEFKKLQSQTISANEKIKELTKKQKEFQEKFFDNIGSAGDIIGDLGKGSAGLTGALGKLGPIGLIIAGLIAPILAIGNESLERGGVFSTKLKVTKDTLTVNDIEELADVTSGTKYLTSDLTVAQRAPNTSNTQNLKYEHVRYVMEDTGRG